MTQRTTHDDPGETSAPIPATATAEATAPSPVARTQPPPAKRSSARFVLLVGSMALLPAVTVDMYLPSLPEVTAELATTTAAVQFTITGMLIGGAIGQLIVGPLSDKLGRRAPVLVGVSLHVVLSLLCVVAATIEQLIALRIVQGLASAGATVIAMAVIRDRYAGADAARLMSRLMLVIAAAPLLAPTIGGFIADHWGWRSVFLALALFGVALVIVVARFLPETLPPERRMTSGISASLRGYLVLLRDRHFLALAVLPGLSMAVIISYVVGSPFVLQEGYGLGAQQFALVFAITGTSMVVTSQVNAALVQRIGPLRLLRVALPAGVVLACGLVAVAATGAGGVVGIVTMLWLTMGIIGFVMANASAIALTRHGERAGTAAATIGFLQAGVAAVISPVVGLLGSTAVAMSAVMLASLVAALLVLALVTPAYRRGGWLG